MSSLSLVSSPEARGIALLPVSTDDGASALVSATRFPSTGAWAAGDSIVIGSSQAFHVLAGGVAVTATTSSPRLPAGLYKMTMPDGCDHVSMIDSADAAGVGQAYRG